MVFRTVCRVLYRESLFSPCIVVDLAPCFIASAYDLLAPGLSRFLLACFESRFFVCVPALFLMYQQ